eukprot:Lithocolla_globosa_v1_NODE_2409_length_2018_cov_37.605706.p2 type:complete len:247 gc:universal NODE_2409_length_2018_cov_37.605706:586-1326(+)
MECTRDMITANIVWVTGGRVATGFHNVNFTRRRPFPVHVVFRHHPNGRPQPVSRRDSGTNLNTTVSHRQRVDGAYTTRTDRVQNVATSSRHALTPIEGISGAEIGRGGAPEVHEIATLNILFSNHIGSHLRLEVKHTVFHKRSGTIVGVILEFPISAATKCDFVLPEGQIKFIKGVFLDQTQLGRTANNTSKKETVHVHDRIFFIRLIYPITVRPRDRGKSDNGFAVNGKPLRFERLLNAFKPLPF